MGLWTAGMAIQHMPEVQELNPPRAVGRGMLSQKHWAIILAGGRGERMRDAICAWMGTYRPKQFCRFVGDRTMLEYTWDRARQIVSPHHIVTVSVADQAQYFAQMKREDIPGTLLYQPDHSGTAAAIYLALAHILARDPEANVIILPSDHFVAPESRFVAVANQALAAVFRDPAHMILLGAEASWPNPDFGWIIPRHIPENSDDILTAELQPVVEIFEKPDNHDAQRLFSQGAMWSTMIVATRGKLLWQLAEALQPKFFLCFLYLHHLTEECLLGNMQKETFEKAVANTFRHMPALDFARDLLQFVPRHCLLLPMANIDWDDWGRPERVLHCIEQHGLISSFDLPKHRVY